jgi:hypothetical protein
VRARKRQERREHHGLHRGRRPADGHALRRDRSRRAALPDGRARHGRARDREADLPALRLARRLGHLEPRAKLAVDLYLYRIRRELGSLAAALGGVDAIVFTAGIGENSAAIRACVLADAAWLGVKPNTRANAKGGPRISAARSRVSAWAIPTNEELMIARHTRRVLAAP